MSIRIRHSSTDISAEDFSYIDEIVRDNFVGPGPFLEELERSMAALTSQQYCIAVNSGYNALLLALLALKKRHPEKSKVIIGAYMCIAVVNSIRQAGLEPYLVDVNENNLNINAEAAATAIDDQVLVVVAASIGGIPIDIDKFRALGIPVIDDSCQSIGASFNNILSGSEGDINVFSFSSTKLITGGIGGAVTTNDDGLHREMKALVTCENTIEYFLQNGVGLTHNMTLPDLNAGLILSQLGKLELYIEKRRLIAAAYDEHFTGKGVKVYVEQNGERSNYYRYFVLTENKDNIMKKFMAAGVDVRPSLAHTLADYPDTNSGQLPNLQKMKSNIISIPIYPKLSKEDLELISNVIDNV